MVKRIIILSLLSGISILPAFAQAPEPMPVGTETPGKTPPAPVKLPPIGADPQESSANYGDWTLRCHRNADAKFCEFATTIRAVDPRGFSLFRNHFI
ncbi:hypothetical protein [uncultured Rhodoblastus sp.]|uniref:hypothetical protein n=1 Tax=uncultured Rhodoblastus sp. TaxID=543037 RepID=UPI0025D102D8|nr:hypothetical protein [uncultured Rhodoblastus sp.]